MQPIIGMDLFSRCRTTSSGRLRGRITDDVVPQALQLLTGSGGGGGSEAELQSPTRLEAHSFLLLNPWHVTLRPFSTFTVQFISTILLSHSNYLSILVAS
jgi:hypothetical protein